MLIRRTIIKAGGKAVSETLEIGMAEYIFLQDLNDYKTKIEGEWRYVNLACDLACNNSNRTLFMLKFKAYQIGLILVVASGLFLAFLAMWVGGDDND